MANEPEEFLALSPHQVAEHVAVADELARQLFKQLKEVSNKLYETYPDPLAESIFRNAIQAVYVSVLTNGVMLGAGLSDEKAQKIADELHEKFNAIAHDLMLQNGAKILQYELPENGEGHGDQS